MLQQSHSVCSVIRDVFIHTFAACRFCLCFNFHPSSSISQCFFVLLLLLARTQQAPQKISELSSRYSYAARSCVGRESLYEMRIFICERAKEGMGQRAAWGSRFFGGAWFDVMYNIFFILHFFVFTFFIASNHRNREKRLTWTKKKKKNRGILLSCVPGFSSNCGYVL